MTQESHWTTRDLVCRLCDEYPYLAQLSVPDRLRLAAYEAHGCGVPEIHLRAAS